MHQIKARVIDAQTKEPLIAATVAVVEHATKKILEHNGRKLATTTDDKGSFTLNLPTLDYDDIIIAYMGYNSLYLDPRTIQATPVISLSPTAYTLPVTEVTGTPRPRVITPQPEPRRSFPEWAWAIIIPLAIALIYFIYKTLNHGKAGNAQPAIKLR